MHSSSTRHTLQSTEWPCGTIHARHTHARTSRTGVAELVATLGIPTAQRDSAARRMAQLRGNAQVARAGEDSDRLAERTVRSMQRQVLEGHPHLDSSQGVGHIRSGQDDRRLCAVLGVKKHKPFAEWNGNLPTLEEVRRISQQPLSLLNRRELKNFKRKVRSVTPAAAEPAPRNALSA